MRITSLHRLAAIVTLCLSAALSGCGSLPASTPAPVAQISNGDMKGNDVVVFALGLVETEYRFGGKNPEAGLDCSGMVSYVFDKAAGLKLSGSAADIARRGRGIDPAQLKPGDLVFFNTARRPYSHVGIYIGDQRFVHAPSRNGKVRTDSLNNGWYAARFEEARNYFD